MGYIGLGFGFRFSKEWKEHENCYNGFYRGYWEDLFLHF